MEILQEIFQHEIDLKQLVQILEDIDENHLNNGNKSLMQIGFEHDTLTLDVLKILEGKINFESTDFLDRNFLHLYLKYSKNAKKEMIEYLIEKGVHVEGLDSSKKTMMHYLYMREKGEEVLELNDYLLEKSNNILSQDESGKTALHCLAESNTIKCKIEVMNKIENLDEILLIKDNNGFMIIHFVVLNPSTTIEEIDFLASKNEMYKSTFLADKKNILQLYCKCENPKIEFIKYFIEQNIDPLYLDENQSNLVHYICQNKTADIEILKFLMGNYEIDFNSKESHTDCAPIHLACLNEKVDFVEYFLLNNVDPNVVGPFSKTPLVIACDRNVSTRIIDLLLKYKVDQLDFALQVSCSREPPNIEAIKVKNFNTFFFLLIF